MIAYLVNLATLASIFGVLAVSLNIMIGYAGIFSIAHAVFFGIGAYAGAQITIHYTPDLFVACAVAGICAALLSVCLAFPALRVRGEYFVVASLGLQMLATTVFGEAQSLTGGIGGLVGIPLPRLFGMDVGSPPVFLAVCLCILAALLLVTNLLMRGSFGRSLVALRDSERAAEAQGKNVRLVKTLAVALSCAMAGVAGALFAFQISFVNVESFTLAQSMLILAMVIIGGTGTLFGPLIGAVLLLLLPAALSFLPFVPPTEVGVVQQLIYGSAMVILMMIRPAGIAGRT
jgi:branched-chain amino acid transport system permease protein